MSGFIYIPENIDIKGLLPNHLCKYTDNALYFIYKIYQNKVFNKKYKDDFIPLKAEYLRNIISKRKYASIKKALLSSGLIETDNWFIKGQKCIGYRLSENYRNAKFKKYELSSKLLTKNISKQEKVNIQFDVHDHLFHQMQKITIDHARAVASNDYAKNSLAIEMINDRSWFFHPDEYGRVHTNITNLKSSIRPLLAVGGERLVEIDIVNSQPYFFAIAMLIFLNKNKTLTNYNYINIPSLYSITMEHFSRDITQFLELVSTGKFYEHLAELAHVPVKDRKKFKVKFFAEVFFCRNRWVSNYAKLFAGEFPSVYEVIRHLKQKDYTFLSKHLQTVESSFVLNRVVRRFMEERPDMFVTTIHDSILVRPQDVCYAKDVLKTELSIFGLSPTVKVKG